MPRHDVLMRLVRETKPRRILEVGVALCENARDMISIAKEFHPASEIEYYGFDLFADPPDRENDKTPHLSREEAGAVLGATGVAYELIAGDSRTSFPASISRIPDVDFAFIDGGHSIQTIESDFFCVQHLMHDQTVVVLDDYWQNCNSAGCKPVVEEIDRSVFDVEILNGCDVLWSDPRVGGHDLIVRLVKVTRRRLI